MYTKINLKIELYNSISKLNDNIKQEIYYLKITILDIDERFQPINYNGNNLRFRGDDFFIKSCNDYSLGEIFDGGIILPQKEKCGFSQIKGFDTDKERKYYLKTLLTTLEDWSNYWWGFSKDSISKLTKKDEICKIECKFINDDVVLYDFC